MKAPINNHPFYVEHFDGLHEVILQPASTQSIVISKQDVCSSFYKAQMDALSMPNDGIDIVIYDNYGRKYKKKTRMSIGAISFVTATALMELLQMNILKEGTPMNCTDNRFVCSHILSHIPAMPTIDAILVEMAETASKSIFIHLNRYTN